MSSLACKLLCIVINFLVLWSIRWSSSFIHCKNGPEYLRRGTARVFIPLMWFLIYSLVLSSFLFSWDTLFKNLFFYLHLLDGIRFQYSQVLVSFLLSKRSDFFGFDSSIPSVICRFPLFIIISKAHFSMLNSIPLSLTVYPYCLY